MISAMPLRLPVFSTSREMELDVLKAEEAAD